MAYGRHKICGVASRCGVGYCSAPVKAQAGRRLGTLYAANTAGAVVGAGVAGFYGLPSLGVVTVGRIAAITAIALGCTVLLALRTPLLLEPETVHTWTFSLGGSDAFVSVCRDSLSPAERQRADRFVFARHRTRYTVAHGVLRHILSRYCGVSANSLDFNVTSTGKPSLRIPGA